MEEVIADELEVENHKRLLNNGLTLRYREKGNYLLVNKLENSQPEAFFSRIKDFVKFENYPW